MTTRRSAVALPDIRENVPSLVDNAIVDPKHQPWCQETGWTSAHEAAWRGDVAGTMEALFLGRDVPSSATHPGGILPLHVAAYAGHVDVIDVLLGVGAAINALDARHRTALHWAVEGNQNKALQRLLEVSIWETSVLDDTGKTPWQRALESGRFDLLETIQSKVSEEQRTWWKSPVGSLWGNKRR